MKILVVAHVYYPNLWPELASCIRNIDGERDVVVTYADETSVTEARRDFPGARFLKCENRGYDLWPFLAALQEVDLGDYDLVVKLHTKRDIDQDLAMNHAWFADSRWRDCLLAFVRTKRAWRRTLAGVRRPGVGMVADRHVIFDRETTGDRFSGTFDRARSEIRAITGIDPGEGLYVAGTMFAARASALACLLTRRFAAADFEAYGGHDRETYAHVMERMLGLCIGAAGLRIAAFNGSIAFRRWYYSQTPSSKVVRFFFRKRVHNWRYSVCVLGIPIFIRRMRRIDQLVGCASKDSDGMPK